jgi:hypothetical protein
LLLVAVDCAGLLFCSIPNANLFLNDTRYNHVSQMTPDERQKMNLLSVLIQHEKDLNEYDRQVKELFDVIEAKRKRLLANVEKDKQV